MAKSNILAFTVNSAKAIADTLNSMFNRTDTAITVGKSDKTLALTSSDWAISATGAMTGIGAISTDGALSTTSTCSATGGFIAGGDTTVTLTKTVEISSTEIKALAATPKEIVAAPGADKFVQLIDAVVIHDFGTAAYAEPSAPDDMQFQYDGGSGGAATGDIDATGLLTATADTFSVVAPTPPVKLAAADNVNKNLVLINTGGEYTTGDGTVTVKVTYRVLTMGLA
jgi:hypothetical protein